MAAAPGRTRCVKCGKEKATLKCGGCLQDFCYNHSTEHRNELSKQLDEVETTRDMFRQTLTDQTTKPEKHALMQQIEKWERDSITKIRHTADEARQILLKHTTGHVAEIETKLNRLTDRLRESREENDFFETDLRQWKEELIRLTEQLTNPSDITIQQDSTPLVTKIYIDVESNKSGKCNL
jgi:chromosome segregation ATPase